MICQAESEQELREKIAQDPYVVGKVWESWDIYPYRKWVSVLNTLLLVNLCNLISRITSSAIGLEKELGMPAEEQAKQ